MPCTANPTIAGAAWRRKVRREIAHLDATLSMSPYSRWLRGADEVRAWYTGPGSGCAGSRLWQITANGSPAFAQYRPGGHAWALHVLEVDEGRITAINSFLDTDRLFPLFGLPTQRRP